MRFTISRKFLVIFAVLATFGFSGWFVMESIVTRLMHSMDLIDAVGSIRWLSQRIQVETIRSGEGKVDSSVVGGWLTNLDQALQEVSNDEYLRLYADNPSVSGALTALRDTLGEYRDSVRTALSSVHAPAGAGRQLDAISEHANEMLVLADALAALLRDEIKLSERRRASFAIASVIVLGLLALLLALLAIRKQIVRPLQKLGLASRQLAEGRIEACAIDEPAGEIGDLARAFNRMALDVRKQRFLNAEHLAAIEKSRQLLSKILGALPVGVWVIDRAGRTLMENLERQTIWGKPDLSLADLDAGACVAWHEDGSELKCGDWPIERVLSGSEPVPGEIVSIRSFDGSIKTVLMSAVPLVEEDGGLEGAIGVIKDVSARQRAMEELRISKELFRICFDSAAAGIALLDLAGRFLMVNDALCEMLGFCEDELLRKNFSEVVLPDDPSSKDVVPGRFEAEGYSGFSREVRCVRRDERVIWGLLSIAAAKDQDSMPIYIVAQIFDISKRKQVEEKLIDSRSLLRKLAAHHDSVREAERKRIALEIHDELGQLLTALKMDLSLLAMRLEDDPDATRKTEEMNLLVEKTIGVVRSLASNLRPAALDLGIVPAVQWLTADFRRRSGMVCNVDLPDEEIDLGNELATTIFRIVQESLTNIMRHSAATSAWVSLRCEGDSLTLRISDNGRGFEADEITHTEAFGLLGIRERVLGLGGVFELDSREGHGTTLALSFPGYQAME